MTELSVLVVCVLLHLLHHQNYSYGGDKEFEIRFHISFTVIDSEKFTKQSLQICIHEVMKTVILWKQNLNIQKEFSQGGKKAIRCNKRR